MNKDYAHSMQDDLISRQDAIASDIIDRDENSKENRNARIIYDFLKNKIGSKIIDNPFEFEDWYNRMIWHVQECYRLQKKYEGGEMKKSKTGEMKKSKTGKWIEIENGEYLCSNCSRITIGYPPNYCPNCRSFNGGEEE